MSRRRECGRAINQATFLLEIALESSSSLTFVCFLMLYQLGIFKIALV